MNRESERVHTSLGRLDRYWHVITAAVVAIAAVGFLTGIRGGTSAGHEAPQASDRPSQFGVAPTYQELRNERRGPNSGLHEGAFQAMQLAPLAAVQPRPTPEQRAAARLVRARRRAFTGAPPTIPHATEQGQTPDCLACHEHGARIADKVAPAMSHTRYDSCTQCHVVGDNPLPAFDAKRAFFQPENVFTALGSRPNEPAWPGAPPPVPHALHMRSNCLSCHGAGGHEGLRTPHPARTSCLQCHAPSNVGEAHSMASRSAP